jgi:uracil-DNA glycosylase family 4
MRLRSASCAGSASSFDSAAIVVFRFGFEVGRLLGHLVEAPMLADLGSISNMNLTSPPVAVAVNELVSCAATTPQPKYLTSTEAAGESKEERTVSKQTDIRQRGPGPWLDCWVPGNGPIPCACMIVGEAPGPDECAAEKPFVGQAGRFLRAALRADPEKIRITNTVKFFPGYDANGDILDPSPGEIRRGFPCLKDEISETKPRYILALGAIAIETLTGYSTAKRAREEGERSEGCLPLLEDFGHPAQVMPTWHPSFIMQRFGRKHEEEWRHDIERFAAICIAETM